ncbi:MAG: ATP-binding cassette domain-containing protein [Salinarimonadaceae bacterium]|nr:MAG: ATP-binding cassette domain-containing protein [Salinarimonadaceae bacterium]
MHGSHSILPLRVRGLGLTLDGARLINDVSFDIPPRSRTVVIGPNGAGKSLLLRLCHGLLAPSEGDISWSGPAASDGRKRHAMVFQRPVMLRRSALANLTHALALAGLPLRERNARAEAALERFGLGALAHRPARVLSGGEQQRLAIARAWALRPELLFLDEPTSALDPAATRAIEAMIATIHAEGVAIVMTTHDLGQARRHADEVLFLHRGRIVERSPAYAFFERPATPEARAFVAGELVW